MNTPEAFEQEVYRIHELLERSNDAVTWNEHIPDPDNPGQLRQIDVTVRRDGKLTMIECRLTRSKQNVKWIEELMGRRQSLNADNVIAVCSAGFTKGAQRKAARFGVLLRDLRQLTDEEIISWGGQTTLVLYYYQYFDVKLAIGFSPKSITELDKGSLAIEVCSHGVLQSVFNAAAQQLDTLDLIALNNDRKVRFGVLIAPENVRLGGHQVLQVGLQGKAVLAAKPITSAGVVAYGKPQAPAGNRLVTIERFEGGQASIAHDQDRIAIELDLSSIHLPPLSQIRYLRTTSPRVLEHESFAISNPGRLWVSGPLPVDIYAVDQ